jgi:hypothetical protein
MLLLAPVRQSDTLVEPGNHGIPLGTQFERPAPPLTDRRTHRRRNRLHTSGVAIREREVKVIRRENVIGHAYITTNTTFSMNRRTTALFSRYPSPPPLSPAISGQKPPLPASAIIYPRYPVVANGCKAAAPRLHANLRPATPQ